VKKIFLILIFLYIPFNALAVEQKYMPDGYIRDDTIHPYYVKLTNDYFQKVDSGKIKCDYKSYRKEVELPLDKIIQQLKRGENPSLNR